MIIYYNYIVILIIKIVMDQVRKSSKQLIQQFQMEIQQQYYNTDGVNEMSQIGLSTKQSFYERVSREQSPK